MLNHCEKRLYFFVQDLSEVRIGEGVEHGGIEVRMLERARRKKCVQHESVSHGIEVTSLAQ